MRTFMGLLVIAILFSVSYLLFDPVRDFVRDYIELPVRSLIDLVAGSNSSVSLAINRDLPPTIGDGVEGEDSDGHLVNVAFFERHRSFEGIQLRDIDYNNDRVSPFTRQTRQAIVDTVLEEEMADAEEVMLARMNVIIRGIIYNQSAPLESSALIVLPGRTEIRIVKAGDTMAEYNILEVTENSVVLDFENSNNPFEVILK